jgi:hypothetical protein
MSLDFERVEGIKNIYQEILKREADQPGLQAYYSSDLSLEQIRISIEGSDERLLIVQMETALAGEPMLDEVESWLYLGHYPLITEQPKLLEKGITHILDITDLDKEEGYDKEAFTEVFKVSVPSNAVISTSDVIKSLKFIKEVRKQSRKTKCKLLVCDEPGKSKAPAVLVLWYVANGMDEEAASAYILSRKAGVSLDATTIGPWHVSAAETAFE